jgi:hypothetical protein
MRGSGRAGRVITAVPARPGTRQMRMAADQRSHYPRMIARRRLETLHLSSVATDGCDMVAECRNLQIRWRARSTLRNGAPRSGAPRGREEAQAWSTW